MILVVGVCVCVCSVVSTPGGNRKQGLCGRCLCSTLLCFPSSTAYALLRGPVLLIKAHWWHSQSESFVLYVSQEKNTKKCVFPNMLHNRARSRHFYLEHWKTVEHLPLVYWIIQGMSVIIGCMRCGCIVCLYMWCLIMATFDSLLSVLLQAITMRVLHNWLCPYSPYTEWNKKENQAHSLLLSPTWYALNICIFLDLWPVKSNNIRMNIIWVWKSKWKSIVNNPQIQCVWKGAGWWFSFHQGVGVLSWPVVGDVQQIHRIYYKGQYCRTAVLKKFCLSCQMQYKTLIFTEKSLKCCS